MPAATPRLVAPLFITALVLASWLGPLPARADHCSTNQDDCVALATCTDSPTSPFFTCTCPSGFAGNGRFSGTGCVEINECIADPCDVNAACTNTVGSFVCSCNEGFEGDGFECSAIAQVPLSQSMRWVVALLLLLAAWPLLANRKRA